MGMDKTKGGRGGKEARMEGWIGERRRESIGGGRGGVGGVESVNLSGVWGWRESFEGVDSEECLLMVKMSLLMIYLAGRGSEAWRVRE